ncbi:MAG: membrane-bound lytic murein transglycosylase MltF [Thiotrichales bacterium]|nr:membrane-bound lytic murein transglycosylase MltF [Thiotrichales bacterium]
MAVIPALSTTKRSAPWLLSLAVAASLSLSACNQPTSALQQIKDSKQLVVVTRNSATTYYEGNDGPAGLEYELLKRFANSLDAELSLIVSGNLQEVIPMAANGEVHFAAAGLTVTEDRKNLVRFSEPYQEVTQQLIYRSTNKKPKSLSDIADQKFAVIAGSSHAELLNNLKNKNLKLTWQESTDSDEEEMLDRVWRKELDLTIADSNTLTLNRRLYPELRVAFDLTEPESLAWAFPKSEDDSLFLAANQFIKDLKTSGEMNELLERYYGHLNNFDYVETKWFNQHRQQRLPEFEPFFIQAGARYGIDWQLLAAIGYQESHWRSQAKSPTGVRGIMMLTLPTAEQLGVKSRLDPVQSIWGGAKYFSQLKGALKNSVTEPDLTWLALAAYNVGLGHVRDAQILAEERGGDRNKWLDVKETLPLLQQRRWHSSTRHGYARGKEAVSYVTNIREFYDQLKGAYSPLQASSIRFEEAS